mmetsp:Transcript_2322/g.2564  ORF Transcript_2322/g.2564 Transcript_2322/m.2564 type:complete len:115 (-) Transcript_2322:31-375(-)
MAANFVKENPQWTWRLCRCIELVSKSWRTQLGEGVEMPEQMGAGAFGAGNELKEAQGACHFAGKLCSHLALTSWTANNFYDWKSHFFPKRCVEEAMTDVTHMTCDDIFKDAGLL